eukprot:scaffold1768_cov116-Isochrysis_galbana.AAC.2
MMPASAGETPKKTLSKRSACLKKLACCRPSGGVVHRDGGVSRTPSAPAAAVRHSTDKPEPGAITSLDATNIESAVHASAAASA